MSSKRDRLQRKSTTTQSTPTATPEELAQRLFSKRKPSKAQVEQASQSGIELRNDGYMQFKRFEFTPIGLVLPEDTTSDEWGEVGRILLRLQARLQWLLGDWLAFGEDREWGETYRQIAEEFGYEVATLHNLSSIARRVNFSRRRETLSFGHHETVASLTAQEQEYWLALAEEQGLTRNDLRQELRNANQESEQKVEPLLNPEEVQAIRSALRLLTKFNSRDLSRLEGKQKSAALESVEALETIAQRLRNEISPS
jgi:hypothetical protein